jgi:hypothetical protein
MEAGKMKLKITLNGLAGRVDSQVIEIDDLDIADGDEEVEISDHIHEAIECWVLAPGDSIIIAEVG